MAKVLIRDLNKMYDEVHAVKNVSLEIADREFVVLVGPSGCGKTTTLRMVAGLEDISSGEISIDGRVVNDLAPMDRDIAMVFQNYALYPHMSVRDNMAFGLKMRKFEKPEIERRVRQAAEILGIQALLARKPRQLSGGQRQRVALGRAIVRNPRVFLFDEPLSNLDAALRVQMRVELKRLHERLETTAIYVTHDQVEAMTLGDRVVVMKDGWVQQAGEPVRRGVHRLSGDELRRRADCAGRNVTLGRGAGLADPSACGARRAPAQPRRQAGRARRSARGAASGGRRRCARAHIRHVGGRHRAARQRDPAQFSRRWSADGGARRSERAGQGAREPAVRARPSSRA